MNKITDDDLKTYFIHYGKNEKLKGLMHLMFNYMQIFQYFVNFQVHFKPMGVRSRRYNKS
jgi:hypothetical protein